MDYYLRLGVVAALIAVGTPTAALSDMIVMPNAFTSAEANTGLNTLVRDSGNPRTYQMQIAASELAAVPVGASLTGLRWRLDMGQTIWPPSPVTWPDYEITLAQAANPIAAMSSTFAANMVSPVLVHDGPLTLAANSFPAAGSPTAFGPLILFQTPYTYAGGDLVLLFTHPGSDLTTTRFLDAANLTTPGYGTSFRALSATSFQAATATLDEASFTITQLEFSPAGAVPEPRGWLLSILAAAGVAAYCRWQRKPA